jgi:Spy/CpxP family protein refolding chaperone
MAAAGLVALGLVSSPMAQPFRPPPGPGEGRRPIETIETIKIWKMTEALQLSEDQAIKLFPKLTRLAASRREFHRRQQTLREELAELLRQRPAREVEIKRKLEELDRSEIDFRSLERAVRGELQSILSLEQQARLALFEERFEAEMRRTIYDLRQRRQGLVPGPAPGFVRPGVRGAPPLPVEGGPPER